MIEKPVRRPIVPPIADRMSCHLAFSSCKYIVTFVSQLSFKIKNYLGDNIKCRGVKIYSDMFELCSEFVICESVNRN